MFTINVIFSLYYICLNLSQLRQMTHPVCPVQLVYTFLF